jgi:Fe(3+) dicitrate transport protein
VTFNDIRTVSPSNVIDPNISDEKDLLQTLVYVDRNKVTLTPVYTVCIIMTKLGYETRNPNGSAAVVRYRSNIGTAVTYGFETMFDWNLNRTF